MAETKNMDFEAMLPKGCNRSLTVLKAYGEKYVIEKITENNLLKLKDITKNVIYDFEEFLKKEAEEKEKMIEESIPDEG